MQVCRVHLIRDELIPNRSGPSPARVPNIGGDFLPDEQRSEVLLRLVRIMGATAQFDVRDDGLPTVRVRHYGMKLEKTRFRAPAVRPDNGRSADTIVPSMSRTRILGILVVAGITGAVVAGLVHRRLEPLTIEKVTDNLFLIAGGGGHTAVYLAANGVVLVDTKLSGTVNRSSNA